MATRNQYVLGETFISIAINTVLSVAFVFIAFHGASQIQARSIIADMMPQTFMVTLMSCLIPALLTRRRIRNNALAWHSVELKTTLKQLCMRAVIVAIVFTGAIVLLCWLTLPTLIPTGMGFHSLLLYKAVFGAVLSACVTPWAVSKVLR